MSYAAIISAVVTIAGAVSSTDKVYAYNVIGDSETEWGDLLRNSSGLINALCVSRSAVETVQADMVRYNDRKHQISFRWYYGISGNGSSESTFQALLESFQNAFNTALKADVTLGGTAHKVEPLQITKIVNQQFGEGLVCHYAEGNMEAVERVSRV